MALGATYAFRPEPEPARIVAPEPRPPRAAVRPLAAPPTAPFLLSIDSVPPGAEVFEGAIRLGTTPMEVSVDAASVATSPRTLVVKQAGYLPFTLSQGPSAEAVHRTVSLEATPTAAPVEPHGAEAVSAPHPGHKPKPVETPPAKPTAAPTPEPSPSEPQPQIRMTR